MTVRAHNVNSGRTVEIERGNDGGAWRLRPVVRGQEHEINVYGQPR